MGGLAKAAADEEDGADGRATSAVSVYGDGSALRLTNVGETRSPQMFFALEPAEIARVRRFGACRAYAAGEALANVGEVAQGLTIIISGSVDVLQRMQTGGHRLIVTHGPGSFMGELAQLSGRPALIDAFAKEPVEALVVPTDRLRALLIAEAEL